MKNKEKHINIPNETMRYYTGLIRQSQSKLEVAEKRIKKLEEQLSKFQNSFSSLEGISKALSDTLGGRNAILDQDKALAGGSTTIVTGLTASKVKKLVTAWLIAGELPIPSHDHSDDDKGGDAYANKGAALQ